MARGSLSVKQMNWENWSKNKSDNILIIGDIKRWCAAGRETQSFKSFEFCNIAGLSADVLRDLVPEMVLSPLIGDDFDAIEVAVILRRLGYKGSYRAITADLPRSVIICAEVKAVAPDIDFDLIVLPAETI